MPIEAIHRYHTKVEKIVRYGGSRNESSIRHAFQVLLESYCAETSLELIPELDLKLPTGSTVRPDGTLKDALRQDWGYWESKDQYDDLDAEIANKLGLGYPSTNILFEDSLTAVLVQNGIEVARASFDDALALHSLLTSFVHYEPPRVHNFRDAIERFKEDLPGLLDVLRDVIESEAQTNAAFRQARDEFLAMCQKSINPHLVMADVREMIIQHILTQDIFVTVFENAQFHRENNIAHELYALIDTFYTGELRYNVERRLDAYVKVIKAAAAEIANHHEKQRFLKAVYEQFYRAYNPAGADRLGIVYTPNEIVHFMVDAADHLVHQHFRRFLADPDVEILDPATGTGTFITEIIEHLPAHRLPEKYEHEIHCNEVAILPYYTANLNIEYTYAQKMGHYKPFENICFVDTLDNLGFTYEHKQFDMFAVSAENLERIRRQNERKISVIIGNPPYNANQLNENENNKNREYPGVDARIKDTYIKHSTAQKTKLYDMYTRFLRWASDRLAENGIIAFITNRSFLDARSFDGFRKVVADEFSHIYVVDLGGDVRKNPRLSGPTHNVFAIQTGVAISFFIKSAERQDKACRIYYARRPEMETAREKLRFLATTPIAEIAFEHIRPTRRHTWINQAEYGWDELLPVVSPSLKSSPRQTTNAALFRFHTLGVSTNRDEWVLDHSAESLLKKAGFLIQRYNADVERLHHRDETEIDDLLDYAIKWSATLKRRLLRGETDDLDAALVRHFAYRPYVEMRYYAAKGLSDRLTSNHFQVFGQALDSSNVTIAFSGRGSSKPFAVLAVRSLIGLDTLEKTQCLPRYTYDEHGARLDNITEWAVGQFAERYGDELADAAAGLPTPLDPAAPADARDVIFCYVYAVLHHPAYREKYAQNLKREFPRIPLYDDLAQWAAWGRQLLDLHLHYETVDPYALERVEREGNPNRAPVAKLQAHPDTGEIVLDTVTTLRGVPAQAWEYRLGNRSAIEWVLEYHKERKPRDPTIRAQFNTYRFADHKERVVDLLQRVTTVSVETVRIVEQMREIDTV